MENRVSTIPKMRRVYSDTKANLDALTGVMTEDLGYATDLEALYRYSGSVWSLIAKSDLTFDGATVVYNNIASPTTWTDLDLSAVVGENSAIVMLKFVNTEAGASIKYKFRRNGETDQVNYGVAVANSVAHNTGAYIICTTDSSGILEWDTSAGRNTYMVMEAYWK